MNEESKQIGTDRKRQRHWPQYTDRHTETGERNEGGDEDSKIMAVRQEDSFLK